LISRQDLKGNLSNKAVQIIDVRTENEYKNGHIKGAENIVLTALEDNLDKINTEKTVVIHCQSGVRAAMAYSLLKKYGFENILNERPPFVLLRASNPDDSSHLDINISSKPLLRHINICT